MSLKTVVLAGLVAMANAHIKMTTPAPFDYADGKKINNSPLEADGSDFPCKIGVGQQYGKGPENLYTAGEPAPLKFKGTAVHGGGSCQVALTTDEHPDKNSVWKVIHSIEGGCPAQDTPGNLGDNAEAPVPFEYSFTVPKEIEDGKYTIAWTWFNNVGNREMYMNCGSAKVTGGDGQKDFLKTLPDLFTANIGNGCSTPSDTDLKFPNPGKGKAVEQLSGKGPLADPVGTCQAKGDSSPDTPTDGGNDTPSTPEEPESPSPSSGSGSGDKPTAPGGVFITKAPESGAPAPTGTPETPSVPEVPSSGDTPKAPEGPVTMPENPVEQPEEGDDAPVEDAPVEDAPAKDAPVTDAPTDGGAIPVGDGPSGGFTAGEACDNEGQWNCVDGSSFQRCASGAWSQVMALAAGIQCEGGQSDTLNASAIKSGKRSLRRANRLRD